MEESVSKDKRICLCGCGQEVISKDKQGRARFCLGHKRSALTPYKQQPPKPCACGCGELVRIRLKYGRLVNFKLGHNSRHGNRANENNGQWKGGRVINDHGYIEIRSVGHRRAHKPGYYVGEHVLVMEQHLNACLCDWTIVHHINEIKTDNRIENLQMMTASQHTAHHVRKRGVPPRVGNRWARLV